MIHRKTARGHAEIESTERSLPPRLRTVLVLVDGKRSDEAVLAMIAATTPDVLRDLRTLGMIEPAPAAVATTPAARPTSGERRAGDSRFEPSRFEPSRMPSRFDVATHGDDEPATDHQRDQIERSLKRALGPTADGLVHSVRRAKTVRDLMDVLSTAQRAIANARGQDMADEFASRYGRIDEL